MRNRLRRDGRAKERKRVLLIRRVYMCVCVCIYMRVCVCVCVGRGGCARGKRVRSRIRTLRVYVRAARSENSKQVEGNLIMKHRPCRLPSRRRRRHHRHPCSREMAA